MLLSQINSIDEIQSKRKTIWNYYFKHLNTDNLKKHFSIPAIPDYADHNAHLFFILLKSEEERNKLANYLNENGVLAVSHYLPLHSSPYFKSKHDGRELKETDIFSKQILRLPLYPDLSEKSQEYIVELINKFYGNVPAFG